MRERDGAVEVCATDAFGAVDSHEHGDSPRDVDAEPGAVGLIGERDLVVDAHAEADHDEGAEELGQTLADVRAVGDEPFLVVLCVVGVLTPIRVVKRSLAAVDESSPSVVCVRKSRVGGRCAVIQWHLYAAVDARFCVDVWQHAGKLANSKLKHSAEVDGRQKG
ncbi:unnamed protein product [Phytophthora lilii]|uniref:Unnamed protein product n=1 Tax=Phytophthora lilii TaxID=2077276 RepID=A0A9W6YEF7_9STRA|nr:unnamed protein product [Phytophthora lilii]